MIPKFPDFKKIDVGDRGDVEAYTHRYLPYSDFNFTSLWAWDTSNERMVSELHGNLVVRFTDYATNEPFLSFLGNNEAEQTALQLLDFSKISGMPPMLRFIPEESIKNLHSRELHIEGDQDNFDYILSITELTNLKGGEFKERRHLSTRFLREYPEARFESRRLDEAGMGDKIFLVLRSWEERKDIENKFSDINHEEEAINRLIRTAKDHNLVLSCIFFKEVMIAFSIDEVLPNRYAISHFFKADNSYRGVYDFLNENVSNNLLERGSMFWNWEQDLGIETLRKSKMSYRPISFLKKYKISRL